MNAPSPSPTLLSIAEVERETGLGKDVLRVWEKRYGFPQPQRDERGRRCYAADMVERLRLLRALVDLGERPAGLMALADADLAARLSARRAAMQGCTDEGQADSAAIAEALAAIRADQLDRLETGLQASILKMGLQRFVLTVAAPLCTAVGAAWEAGEISIFQEHGFSEVMGRTLKVASQMLRQIPGVQTPAGQAGGKPAFLVTTVPGEIHALGIGMVEAMLVCAGCRCVMLGPQCPPDQIVIAAARHEIDVVALSFSSWFDSRRARRAIEELRQMLPASVALWVGGSNHALSGSLPDGVRVFRSLDHIPTAAGGAA